MKKIGGWAKDTSAASYNNPQKKIRLNLRGKKALAARLLKVPASRVWFNPRFGRLIKDVDSRDDLRVLIAAGVVRVKR